MLSLPEAEAPHDPVRAATEAFRSSHVGERTAQRRSVARAAQAAARPLAAVREVVNAAPVAVGWMCSSTRSTPSRR